MAGTRIIKYNDMLSTFALWQKVFLIAPLWAYPLIAMIGLVLSFFGNFVSQVGFFALAIWSTSYFIEDVLKRKLSITEKNIAFGFKTFELDKLEAIGLKYGKKRILPSHLLLRFSDGKQLKLKLSRISAEDLNYIVRHVETNFRNCKIDPVVNSLTNLQAVSKKNLSALSEIVEIPYSSHKPLKEMITTFMHTAGGWTRSGPILVAVLFGGNSIMMMYAMYICLIGSKLHLNRSLVSDAVRDLTSGGGKLLGSLIASAGTAFFNLSFHPVIATISIIASLFLMYMFFRVLFQPNLLTITSKGLQKRWNTYLSFTLDEIDWSKVTHASLNAPNAKARQASRTINLTVEGRLQPFELDLGKIDNEDRQLLNQKLKEYAPAATADADFDESMLTRQKSSFTELWLQSLSSPPKRMSVKPLRPGEKLKENQYEILTRLGVGGQGTAYLSLAGKEKVVLKETILPTFVDQAARQHAIERFEKEARLLNELDHPQIVKLTDFFIEDHRSYLVLEHIDGSNLKDLVAKKGALSEDRVRELALQMCEILQYLHALNVVHRDFTPDNLILNQNGVLKLIDFNVAQSEEAGITATVVGKHAYIPPEQFRGKPCAASDLYAMGATLSYLLTGVEPSPITQSNPQESNTEVSNELNEIIKELTILNEKKRLQTAELLKDRLLGSLTLHVPEAAYAETVKNDG